MKAMSPMVDLQTFQRSKLRNFMAKKKGPHFGTATSSSFRAVPFLGRLCPHHHGIIIHKTSRIIKIMEAYHLLSICTASRKAEYIQLFH